MSKQSDRLRIDMVVYHKTIHDYKEPLTIVSIRADKVQVIYDASGGVYNQSTKRWIPIKGLSKIYNYQHKVTIRNDTMVSKREISKAEQAISTTDSGNIVVQMLHRIANQNIQYVLYLTEEIEYEPEFE